MKKTLALVLAAMMTAGMTTVAFANATNNNNLKVTLVGTAGNTLYVDDNDDNHFNTDDDTFDDKKGTNNKGAIAINAPANGKNGRNQSKCGLVCGSRRGGRPSEQN